jgi:hypothetical protein
MKTISFHHPASRRGSALLITLAFLLLLTVLVIGFLTRAVLETQLSVGSATQNKVDLAAQGATETIIGDLQAEIVAGSVAPPLSGNAGSGIYVPNNAFTAIPCPVNPATGSTPYTAVAGMENLVKISYPTAFWTVPAGVTGTTYTGTAPNRASSIPTTWSSLNGRSISTARWNKPILLAPTSATNLAPVATGFTAPNWIYVARDGSNATGTTLLPGYVYSPAVSPLNSPSSATLGTDAVTQRYAYAIYDEGGTLDMNVVGSPMNTPNSISATPYSPLQSYKNALAYADLTQLPIVAPTSSNNATNPPTLMGSTSGGLSTSQQATLINAIVGWRNYASAGTTSGSAFPAYSFPSPLPSTISFNSENNNPTYQPTAFDAFLLGNTTGFLTTGNSSLAGTNQNLSDNAFASRQQLIQFLLQGIGLSSNNNLKAISPNNLTNLLPYLGTFTRGLDAPAYVPPTLAAATKATAPLVKTPAAGGSLANGNDTLINPSFLATTVGTTYNRTDGSVALAGTPLVNKRFPLSRLAWITYEGPSATVMSTGDAGGLAVIKALENDGIPASYLALGNKTNIEKYFGLDYDNTNHRWLYDYNNTASGSGAGQGAGTSSIVRLGIVATAGRDPDFFELLKAAINVGTLGKALAPSTTGSTSSLASDPYSGTPTGIYPPYFNYPYEASVDGQIIQIGANIIDQYQPSAYPIRINFNNGSLDTPTGGHEYVSVENYPYFYGVTTGYLGELDGTVFSSGANLTTTPPNWATPPAPQAGAYDVIQTPIIWNPHDPNSSMGAPGTYPTKFRVVADSTDPLSVREIEGGFGGSLPQANLLVYSQTGIVHSYDPTADVPVVVGQLATTKLTYAQNGGPNGGVGSPGGTIFPLTAADSEIDINPTNPTNPALFREPTAVMIGGTRSIQHNPPSNINGDGAYTFTLGPTHTMITNPIINQYLYNTAANSGVSQIDNNLTNNSSSESGWSGHQSTPGGQNGPGWVGFLLGAAPLEWGTGPAAKPTGTTLGAAEYVTKYNGTPGSGTPDTTGGGKAIYITYRMQYPDPFSNPSGSSTGKWITYDTKYAQPLFPTAASSNTGFTWSTLNPPGLGTGAYDLEGRLVNTNGTTYFSYSCYAVDPRTSRFGLFSHYIGNWPVATPTVNYSFPLEAPEWQGSATTLSWVDDINLLTITVRPDLTSGGWFEGPAQSGMLTTGTGWLWGTKGLYLGFLEQNTTGLQFDGERFENDVAKVADSGANGNFYADPDGVVRRAAGGYVPPGSGRTAASTVGLPLARASAYNLSGGTAPPEGNYIYTGGLEASTGNTGSSTTAYSIPPTSLGYLSQTQSRPYILHRPFRSVAEMGYAFSDAPWKNINFSMPESGDNALLDVFTLNENTNPNALEAGKINLNTRQPYTLAAVLANAYVDDAQIPTAITNQTSSSPPNAIPATGATLGGIQAGSNGNAALAIATALVSRTTDSNSTDVKAGSGPLQNISELVGKYSGTSVAATGLAGYYDGMKSYAGFSGAATTSTPFSSLPSVTNPTNASLMNVYNYSGGPFGPFPSGASYPLNTTSQTTGLAESMAYIQRFHEAPIRALANVGQTRVWNLMIDVIAQTGRFPNAPTTVTTLQNFSVEGERRYWVHVAIDRLTGKVLDEQVEVVKE